MYTEGAGCISSTARRHGNTCSFIINRGAVGGQQLISARQLRAVTHRHMAAEQFGNGALLRLCARHRPAGWPHAFVAYGGMVDFSSALQVEADAGVGAFASINAEPTASFDGGRVRAAIDARLRNPRRSRKLHRITAARHQERVGLRRHVHRCRGPVAASRRRRQRLYVQHSRHARAARGFRRQRQRLHRVARGLAHCLLVFTRAGSDGKGIVTKRAGRGLVWAPAYQGTHTFPHRRNGRSTRATIGLKIVDRQHPHRLAPRPALVQRRDTARALGRRRFYLRDEPTSPEWVAFQTS